MKTHIVLDDIHFQIEGNRVLWQPPSAKGEWKQAPQECRELVLALAHENYEDEEGRLHILGKPLIYELIDYCDQNGTFVPEGYHTGLTFAVLTGTDLSSAHSFLTLLEEPDSIQMLLITDLRPILLTGESQPTIKVPWVSLESRRSIAQPIAIRTPR